MIQFDDLRPGELIQFQRVTPCLADHIINRGLFLGFTWGITPSGVGSYARLHMLEFGGRLFSVICWIEKDTITKIE